MEVTIKQPNLTDAPLPIPSTVIDAPIITPEMIASGVAAYRRTPPWDRIVDYTRSHDELCRDIYLAMQSARTPDTIAIPSVVQERDEG